ncbi:MAG: xylulokinase, partial [Spirochaetota bacterium]
KPVLKLNFIEEATSVGAAIAGGVGVGIFSSINDSEKLVHITEETKPQTENIEVYERNYRVFKDSIERLNDIFVMLSDQKN